MANTVIQSSGIALINNGKIFLIKPYMSTNDKWGIPKGHIEVNEDIQKTAIREFTEETGIKLVGVLKYFTTVSTRYNDTIKNVNVYKCVGTGTEAFIKSNLITEGDMAGNPENIDGRWFTYNEAVEKIHKYQIPIVKKLKDEDGTFKSFYDNRDTTLVTNGLQYNKTISILLYDTRMNPSNHLYMIQKYLNISDEVILFITRECYKTFNDNIIQYFKNNIPKNLIINVVDADKIYIKDIIDYINRNLKRVNIILGSDKQQMLYKSLYELYEYLYAKPNINVLDLKKYTL